MAEIQLLDQQHMDSQSPSAFKDDMLTCVIAMEASLLHCLPARELQAIDRSPHPSHQTSLVSSIDVEKHSRDFMDGAKKLQLYFACLQQGDHPTRAETLQKEIALMQEELKMKNKLINQQEKLIQGWKDDLKDQFDKHNTELERV